MADKILNTEEAWDNRELGADERFVRRVEVEDEFTFEECVQWYRNIPVESPE